MFNFQNFQVFWLLIPTLALTGILLITSYRKDKKVLRLFGVRASRLKVVALFIVWTTIFSSLFAIFANPQEHTPTEAETLSTRGDYVFLVDTSISARASESPSSRSQLQISKDIILEIIDRLPARFQLFVFERVAMDITPLNSDVEYLRKVLDLNFYAGMIAVPGSDIAEAIHTIIQLKRTNPNYSDIEYMILFSDGDIRLNRGETVVVSALLEALELARIHGLRVITVGVGSAIGWKIPIYDESGNFTGEYVKEKGSEGHDFVSVLNENNLRVIADETGGKYFYYTQTNELMQHLSSTLSNTPVVDGDVQAINIKNMDYVYAWVVVGGLFVLLLFRRQLL